MTVKKGRNDGEKRGQNDGLAKINLSLYFYWRLYTIGAIPL